MTEIVKQNIMKVIMKDFILSEKEIMDFEFYNNKIVEEHLHPDVEIFYVLEGDVDFSCANRQYRLRQDDFLVVNTLEHHSYSASDNVLAACIHINYSQLRHYSGLDRMAILCNTVSKEHDSYDVLRRLFKKMFNCYFDKKGLGLLYLNSLYYLILNTLLRNFLLFEDDIRYLQDTGTDTQRVTKILNYIYANYKSYLSLRELSDKLFLSNAYLSKYIKKKLGMNLIEYVNNVRLFHAVHELKTTDKSIIHVALDNGFPNVSAFNKVFKSVYHITPSEFLKQEKQPLSGLSAPDSPLEGGRPAPEMAASAGKSYLSQKVREYLDNNPVYDEQELRNNYTSLVVDASARRNLTRYWMRLINIGKASDLLHSEVQEHILLLKRNLQFSHIRFWDFYADELMLNITQDREYNFVRLDRIFDFLVEHDISPYIELGFKPNLLLRNTSDYMIESEQKILFQNNREYGEFLKAMLIHFVKRYGKEITADWYFEQWNDPRLRNGEDYTPYFDTLRTAYRTIKSLSPDSKVGGAGYNRSFDGHNFAAVIELWTRQDFRPDFISLYGYPYVDDKSGTNTSSKNPSFIRDWVKEASDILHLNGLYVPQLHISEWNFSVSNRNYLHDTCFKGAFMLKTMMELLGSVHMMGYWTGSDLFSEFLDNPYLINGSGGLISHDGIKKPAFYAMDFMNRHGEYLLGSHANSMITCNLENEYFITCHNYKQPNFRYYLMAEDAVELSKTSGLFDDDSNLKILLQIKHVKNGTYQVKTRSLSPDNGSIADEWRRLGMSKNLNRQEIEYLKNICTPQITIRTVKTQDETLYLETLLKAHEIQSLHISLL